MYVYIYIRTFILYNIIILIIIHLRCLRQLYLCFAKSLICIYINSCAYMHECIYIYIYNKFVRHSHTYILLYIICIQVV